MENTTLLAASLHCGEGSSDKVYNALIESRDDGYVVTFACGRRSNTLNTGAKTQSPVSLEKVESIHKTFVALKLAKGYKTNGEVVTPHSQVGEEGCDSGTPGTGGKPPVEVGRPRFGDYAFILRPVESN